MRRLSTSVFGFMALFGLTTGCLSNDANSGDRSSANDLKATETKTDAQATADSLASAAKVASAWQVKMFEAMKANQATEAWGLFSSSGWVDKGQIMVFGDKGVAKQVTKVQPAATAADAAAKLSDAKAKAFSSTVAKANKLGDYTPENFDGVKYEYVHAIKTESGEIKILHRVFMVNLGHEKKMPEHERLVAAFKAL